MSSLSSALKNTIKSPIEKLAATLGPHRRQGQPRLWVLMYHRILPVSDLRYHSEEPGMIVEPETFREHIRQLKQLFTILPLSEWVDRRNSGKSLPTNSCAITFDDGWADNYQYAFPIIQQEQVPTTLFAVSDMIGSNRKFWPNRISNLLHTISIDQLRELHWLSPLLLDIGQGTVAPDQLALIIDSLKNSPDNTIIEWLDEAEKNLEIPVNTSQPLVSWSQLKSMSDSGLVTIGSHTCNHYRLQDSLDRTTMANEIINSQKRLQEELRRPVDLFCFPNGDVCPAALDVVKKHYKGAVTTQRGINSTPNSDSIQLKRIGVHQAISNNPTKFQARLANWF